MSGCELISEESMSRKPRILCKEALMDYCFKKGGNGTAFPMSNNVIDAFAVKMALEALCSAEHQRAMSLASMGLASQSPAPVAPEASLQSRAPNGNEQEKASGMTWPLSHSLQSQAQATNKPLMLSNGNETGEGQVMWHMVSRWGWRKYGKKMLSRGRGSPFKGQSAIAMYYKCSHPGCDAREVVMMPGTWETLESVLRGLEEPGETAVKVLKGHNHEAQPRRHEAVSFKGTQKRTRKGPSGRRPKTVVKVGAPKTELLDTGAQSTAPHVAAASPSGAAALPNVLTALNALVTPLPHQEPNMAVIDAVPSNAEAPCLDFGLLSAWFQFQEVTMQDLASCK